MQSKFASFSKHFEHFIVCAMPFFFSFWTKKSLISMIDIFLSVIPMKMPSMCNVLHFKRSKLHRNIKWHNQSNVEFELHFKRKLINEILSPIFWSNHKQPKKNLFITKKKITIITYLKKKLIKKTYFENDLKKRKMNKTTRTIPRIK